MVTSKPRWYELAPEILLIVGLTIFLADEPNAATSAFKSPRALALMAVVAVVWLGARLLSTRLVPWRLATLGTFTLGAAAILAVVVVPAYDNDTVVETFPGSTPMTTIASAAVPSSAVPPSPAVTTSPGIAPPSSMASPVRIRVGQFRGIDHRASGTVAVYRQADGRYVIGLEDFDIQPGPDYDLYVVPGAERDTRDAGTRLDDLRGNRGTQFYDVPANVDLSSGTWSVLVWCQTFGVPVANATPV
jgi:Electron transfer DM13